MKRSIVRVGSGCKDADRGVERASAEAGLAALDGRVELIQALIPLGLEAVNELLHRFERDRALESELLAIGSDDDWERRAGAAGFHRILILSVDGRSRFTTSLTLRESDLIKADLFGNFR